ncbi:unnamed protein product [Oppiella nova]|uniref:Uncharacterized protein n=1 Tax=Oppiella nova TaxID=334625 RepID=A0A7R9MQR1_9ACAR|nr:unnamed protein product [Oppiella nova]CAG2181487.1 unnamed protein product [Oppiella nova]
MNYKTILTESSLFDDTFSMDVFADYIFWSNYDKNAVLMTHKSGLNGTQKLHLVNAYTDIEGIKVLDASRQTKGANRCESHNCSHMCLPVGRDYRCVCSKDSSDCTETSTSSYVIHINPVQSPIVDSDNNFMSNLSQKLDSLLRSADLMTGATNGSPTHWVIITLVSIAFNLIFISLFLALIYRKRKL